jgi:hypothetical protein
MSERYGRVLGFSLLDKAGGFGEIVEVKTLKEYKLQQTLTVEEAMLNTARMFAPFERIYGGHSSIMIIADWEEERRIKAPTIQSLLQKLLDHVRQTTWIPSDQTEKIVRNDLVKL